MKQIHADTITLREDLIALWSDDEKWRFSSFLRTKTDRWYSLSQEDRDKTFSGKWRTFVSLSGSLRILWLWLRKGNCHDTVNYSSVDFWKRRFLLESHILGWVVVFRWNLAIMCQIDSYLGVWSLVTAYLLAVGLFKFRQGATFFYSPCTK